MTLLQISLLKAPPSWLADKQDAINRVRPKYRRGLAGLWLPHLHHGSRTIPNLARVGISNAVFGAGAASPVWQVTGKYPSIYLGAQDYLSLGNGGIEDLTTDFTIGIWVKFKPGTSSSGWFGNQDGQASKHGWMLYNQNNLQFYGGNGGWITFINPLDNVPDSVWNLIVVTQNSSQAAMYSNGALLGVDGAVGALSGSAVDFRVGMIDNLDYSSTDFTAWIGPMFVYNNNVLADNSILALSRDFWHTLFEPPPWTLGLPGAPATTTIQLDWTDVSGHEDGFSIERKTDAGAFGEIDTVAAGIETYNNVDVPIGHTYTYRVKATSTALGDSEYSNEAAETV